MNDEQAGRQEIGVFVMTWGQRAPGGGYRQCRVLAMRSGKLVLAPMDQTQVIEALIRTVSLTQLDCILNSFYALPEEATG